MTGSSHRNGIIFALKRYSIHDGPGIRTTVFLKGCPLSCWWCHNPEGIPQGRNLMFHEDRCLGCGDCKAVCPSDAVVQEGKLFVTDSAKCALHGSCVEICPSEAREIVGESVSAEELTNRLRRDIAFYDQSGGGVTFSGGEPLMQPVFLRDCLESCRRSGLHTAVDTSGHADQSEFESILDVTDLFLFDLKLMDTELHLKYTGVDNRQIRQNAAFLSDHGKDIVIRIPLIPGITDSEVNIEAIAQFAAGLKTVKQIDLLPYHKMSLEKYRRLHMDAKFRAEEAIPKQKIQTLEALIVSKGFEVSTGG